MKKKVIGLIFTFAFSCGLFALSAPVEAANNVEQSMGQICLFPYNYTPMYWALCSGQTMYIAENSALYSLLGTTFGGNGSTTFALPNLTSASPYSATGSNTAHYFMATSGNYGGFYGQAIGEVCLLPDTVVTKAASMGDGTWLKCDGSSYNTATYPALYVAIGAKFGSSLPDLSHASPLAGLNYYIACNGDMPADYFAGSYEFIGNIDLFAFSTVPTGMLPCDGRTLTISEYSFLYSLIGPSYGGNGSTTFCIPDMRGLAPLPGLTYCISTMGAFPPHS